MKYWETLLACALAASCATAPTADWREQSAMTHSYAAAGETQLAIESAQRTLQLVEGAHYGMNDPIRLRAIHELALSYAMHGETAEAERLWKQNVEAARTAEQFPAYDLAIYTANLARLYHLQGRAAEAQENYVLSYALWMQAGELSPSEQEELSAHISNYAELLRELGRDEEADRLLANPIAN